MTVVDGIRKTIVDFLIQHHDELLKVSQMRHCAPCGGLKSSMVYRSPVASSLGKMLDGYKTQLGLLDNGA